MWFDESREIKLIELGDNGFNKSVRISKNQSRKYTTFKAIVNT